MHTAARRRAVIWQAAECAEMAARISCAPVPATLQPTFKRLGINMNTRIANSMMREEAGVALRMLYSIKQNMGQLNKGLQVLTRTSILSW